MNRLYMIEFKLHDSFYFASVFETRHSPSIYYVSLVGREFLANKLVLNEVDDKIELSPDSNRAPKKLVEAIILALESHKDGKD